MKALKFRATGQFDVSCDGLIHEEQIISVLKEQVAGVSVPDIARCHGITDSNIFP